MPHEDTPHAREPGMPGRGLSIRFSLPLLITALAAIVIGLYAAAAYRQMQQSAIDAAGDRLEGVTRGLAGMLGGSLNGYRTDALAVAGNDSVRAFLRNPSASRAAAHAALRPPDNVLGYELLDASGRRVLATHDDLPGGAENDPRIPDLLRRSAGGATRGAVGALRSVRDSLVAPVAAPVMAGDSMIGYVVMWRRVRASEQGRRIEQLIGSSARMYIANEAGDLWTDLSRPVAGPPLAPADIDGAVEYAQPGEGRWLADAADIQGAPWVVVVEFSRNLVLAPARRLLRSLVLLGLLALLLAAAATWALAGRFTAPIMRLADTARALSEGDYERRSTISRRDEVGTLSRAFNRMADNVSGAHAALEHQIEQLALAEARNREVGDRLRQVLSSSPDVIYKLTSIDGVMTFTWISENVERLFGAGMEEVSRPDWWVDHLHPEDRARELVPLRDFGPDHQSTREYRLRHRDGRYRWIRDRQRLDGDGSVVVGAWSDVTELRTLEEQFRQAQKLEAVGRLAGGIAHDFNNIVTVILGESDMALSTLAPGSPLRDSLDQIRTAGDRASLLTRQLLTFSRRQIMETTVFSLNDVVRDLQDMLRRLIGADLNLQLQLAERLGPVNADRGQIEQVLLNLVINARDAMPDGGTIVIETHDVSLDADYARSHPDAVTGDFVALVVSDSGTGMTDEVRAHLFEPFFTTKDPGKGTGLGLATSYGIAREFGGHIGVYSGPASAPR
ncbi:MAG: ATP-binding protein [Longimicrobiales bacterium]